MAKKSLPIAKAAVPAMPTEADKDREMKWRAEDALRDIERAEAHKRDKDLMRHVKKHAKEKIKSMSKICGGGD